MDKRLISLLAALLAGRVDCVVVGGIAVIAHGYLRTTTDLDIFIRPTEENSRATHAVLSKMDIDMDGWGPTDFLFDDVHLRFAVDERFHVDILSSIGDMHFGQVWSGRVEVDFGGVRIPIISKADLIENKLATGRYRDLSDVEELVLIQSPIEDCP